MGRGRIPEIKDVQNEYMSTVIKSTVMSTGPSL